MVRPAVPSHTPAMPTRSDDPAIGLVNTTHVRLLIFDQVCKYADLKKRKTKGILFVHFE